ncbi:hypothetical protein TASIC1_0009021300 [Trichoderma asperellum]|uniref:N-acetyltransferase domain-containing protein n=1 Tax=Trichoderma asperellum TaxID=101201 RepID=A0A6V8R1B1_TRIAP|nr:hypothetical protein TASIC1_0009021300 [Trichoderma asperellum]
MPLQLEDMAFKDGAAYAHTYVTSFQNDAYSRASYADQTFDQRVAGVIRRWPKNYGQTLVTYKKVVDMDTGELVSWVKIGAEAARSRDLGNRPAIVVYLFGTHPKAQRRGAGSLLMAWVTELADREGLACWVTSSEMAVPLYKKFRFEVAEEITVPLPGANVDGEMYTHTCMLREPKKLKTVD